MLFTLTACKNEVTNFTNPEEEDYKEIYLNYFKNNGMNDFDKIFEGYSWVNVDDDGIPELVLEVRNAILEKTYYMVLSYQNHEVNSCQGTYYIEGKGIVGNEMLENSIEEKEIYQLENGIFHKILEAKESTWTDDNIESDVRRYYINNLECTVEEYRSSLQNLFDMQLAKDLRSDIKRVDYKDFLISLGDNEFRKDIFSLTATTTYNDELEVDGLDIKKLLESHGIDYSDTEDAVYLFGQTNLFNENCKVYVRCKNEDEEYQDFDRTIDKFILKNRNVLGVEIFLVNENNEIVFEYGDDISDIYPLETCDKYIVCKRRAYNEDYLDYEHIRMNSADGVVFETDGETNGNIPTIWSEGDKIYYSSYNEYIYAPEGDSNFGMTRVCKSYYELVEENGKFNKKFLRVDTNDYILSAQS